MPAVTIKGDRSKRLHLDIGHDELGVDGANLIDGLVKKGVLSGHRMRQVLARMGPAGIGQAINVAKAVHDDGIVQGDQHSQRAGRGLVRLILAAHQIDTSNPLDIMPKLTGKGVGIASGRDARILYDQSVDDQMPDLLDSLRTRMDVTVGGKPMDDAAVRRQVESIINPPIDTRAIRKSMKDSKRRIAKASEEERRLRAEAEVARKTTESLQTLRERGIELPKKLDDWGRVPLPKRWWGVFKLFEPRRYAPVLIVGPRKQPGLDLAVSAAYAGLCQQRSTSERLTALASENGFDETKIAAPDKPRLKPELANSQIKIISTGGLAINVSHPEFGELAVIDAAGTGIGAAEIRVAAGYRQLYSGRLPKDLGQAHLSEENMGWFGIAPINNPLPPPPRLNP